MTPIKTLCFTFSLIALLAASAVAQTRTLYFYPPDDAKWIAGRSYISQGGTPTALELYPDKCGWYKATFSSTLPGMSQFYLGKSGVDKIGPGGRLSELDDGADPSIIGIFKLSEIFSKHGKSNTVYLVADELDPANADAGWYGTDPGTEDPERCKFKLAAFIYDTDPSVHPDFSCASWNKTASEGNGEAKAACDESPNAANKKGECIGVIKGLVQETLGSDRKIKCKDCTKKSCWTSKEKFEDAFKPTKGVNVERCYNMPFTQVKSGSSIGAFEFDSDKLRQDGSTTNTSSKLVGGFFPNILNDDKLIENNLYTDCQACKTKRTADRYNLIDSTRGGWEKWTTKAIYDTLVSKFYEYHSKEGDFASANKPDKKDIWSGGNWEVDGVKCLATATSDGDGCPLYDWTCRRTADTSKDNCKSGAGAGYKWYLYGSDPIVNTYGNTETQFKTNSKANQHFCFESHADFIYDPEQKFYFSGDDPIWVYIANKLVIDLGGAHLAAPDHVNLDTIKINGKNLEDGKTYPIDIFFCDQRTVNSNVRISTNMYIVQKTNFEPQEKGNNYYMCYTQTSGSDCASKMGMGGSSGSVKFCGPELLDPKQGNHKVEFFMTKNGGRDTVWLSPAKNQDKACTGTGDNFVCYGGIKVNNAVYSCGGLSQCKKDPVETSKQVTAVGNFKVYVRLTDSKGVVEGKPVQIDVIKSDVKTSMVWGELYSMNDDKKRLQLPNAYGKKSEQTQSVIAGKRTPIYVSVGSWDDEAHPTTFGYDDETANGTGYDISISGGAGLKIYKSETGNEEKSSGKLPASGIDTLWVVGAYNIPRTEFTINVTNSKAPALKLTVYPPELRFTEDDYKTPVNSTDGYSRWSNDIPYASIPLPVYLVAWDKERNELCEHCSFTLVQTSTTNSKNINDVWDDGIVQSGDTEIKGGKLTTSISGSDEVRGSDKAEWKVSLGEHISLKWTGLQFKLAPVPMPINSEIYDRNGDGIGDSLIVEFSKSFRRGNSGAELEDSLLLVLLEVVWDKKDTIRYHAPEFKVDSLKDPLWVKKQYDNKNSGFSATNKKYWKDNAYITGDSLSILILKDKMFSKDVLTSGFSAGKGRILSYTPFYDDGLFQYSKEGAQKEVYDRIPPIVVKAEYEYVKNNKASCMEDGLLKGGCQEKLTVYLSEPVFAAQDVTTDLIKNPFSYCFGRSQQVDGCPTTDIDSTSRHNQGWSNVSWPWEQAKDKGDWDTSYSATYRPNTKRANQMALQGTKGDSIVEMVYYSYKLDADKTTRMPKASDWIKIRPPSSKNGFNVFQDSEGNFANPREIGVFITGTNPSRKRQVKIAEIKGNSGDPVLGGTFENEDPTILPWLGKDGKREAKDNLFKLGNVAEFLPVPKEYSHPDSIKIHYPASVGTVFDIADRLHNEATTFVTEKCEKCTVGPNNEPLTLENVAKGITLYATANYHTNLGDYTAHRSSLKVKCTDPIFKNATKGGDGGNCFSNEYNFYLAWDLKANSGRYVGAGAYVAISNFYWQIEYEEGGHKRIKKFGQDEFIEMFGVKRKGIVK